MRATAWRWLVLGLFGALAAVVLADPDRLGAQDIAVPVDVHVPLLLKILNFDRNLPNIVKGQLTIGVLFQEHYRTSANVARAARAAMRQASDDALGGYPLVIVSIDLDAGPDSLAAQLARRQVNALYVAPLRGVDFGALLQASRAAHVRMLTGVPDYVDRGIAVGIDRHGDRPQIVVNLAAARDEGADFGAQLLKLARIIKGEHP